MLLAIDVGNTQTQAGVYSGEELLHEWRISTDRTATEDEIAAEHDQILRLRGGSLGELDEMIVASVVPTLSTAYRSVSLLNCIPMLSRGSMANPFEAMCTLSGCLK